MVTRAGVDAGDQCMLTKGDIGPMSRGWIGRGSQDIALMCTMNSARHRRAESVFKPQ